MGQIIARVTCREAIIKQDINLDYETYGSSGERDYVTDHNLEYESNYDSMYDDMGDMDDDVGQTKKRHKVH